jgi:phenylalanyl-tRNA synthetase beta chain
VYDADTLNGPLCVRKSLEKEVFKGLNNQEYTLQKDIPVIADNQSIHAIAGVIGGAISGCSLDTKNVFLEVALFDADAVTKAGRDLDIITDSRYRFERRVDPLFLEDATHIATQLIVEICGGEVSNSVITGEQPSWSMTVPFDPNYVNELSGTTIDEASCKRILKALSFEIKGNVVEVPSWRSDIQGSADIVEEILRVYGYEHIPSSDLPVVTHHADPAVSTTQARISKTRRLLASRGMMEVVSWSFMSSSLATSFGFNQEGLVLRNPISSDLDAMRPSIIPNLLQASGRNAARGYYNLAFFESGPVFKEPTPFGQAHHITGIRCGLYSARNLHQPERKVDVFDAKTDLLAALESMGAPISNVTFLAQAPSYYHPGRSGSVCLGKQVLAVFGELHPTILAQFDVTDACVAFELYSDTLPAPKRKNKSRSKLLTSDFQRSIRDFAVIVDQSVSAESILRIVRNVDKVLIREVTLFDVYQGKNIESGKKSVAFSIVLLADDRTLTDAEIEKIQTEVMQQLQKQVGASLRS